MGELTSGSHPILAKDVEVGQNKRKVKFTLRSSKTHHKGQLPQIIKITSTNKLSSCQDYPTNLGGSGYCPYDLLDRYITMRNPAHNLNELFFVFSDNSRVTPNHFRNMLKQSLENAGYDKTLFGCHSFRIGHCGDLLKIGLSVESIKKIGRWRSKAVFRYFKE